MNLDFHTHGKLAKYLPFSKEYTNWMMAQARASLLDALCLTEHFNTSQFNHLYTYIFENSISIGDTLNFHGLKIFPGMEVDIAEGGHILFLGKIEDILSFNKDLEAYIDLENFLPFKELMDIANHYSFLVGAAHPFREGSNIPHLSKEELTFFDFIDLNGKDLANNRELILKKSTEFSQLLNIPLVTGSDTHQALQYGCNWTEFENDINTFEELHDKMISRSYKIEISENINFQVKAAKLLKKSLKEIHRLKGDYVKVLIEDNYDTNFSK